MASTDPVTTRRDVPLGTAKRADCVWRLAGEEGFEPSIP